MKCTVPFGEEKRNVNMTYSLFAQIPLGIFISYYNHNLDEIVEFEICSTSASWAVAKINSRVLTAKDLYPYM